MEIQPIHLSFEEFKKIQERKIGYGTDGSVYKYNRKELIKVYHQTLHKILSCIEDNNDEDIKIYEKDSGNKLKEKPTITAYFYNAEYDEHLRLPTKDAIKYAVSLQKNVTMTKLPKNVVYVDNIFAGTLIDKIHGIELHKLMGLSRKYKKILILKIIKKVTELLENNIYYVELDNSPFSEKALYMNESGVLEKVGHSNILVNNHFEPCLIDLDGKTTIYTEVYNEEYERACLESLCKLIIEFLLEIDLDEIEEYSSEFQELDCLCDLLEKAHVNSKYIKGLSEYNLNLKEIEEVVKTLK